MSGEASMNNDFGWFIIAFVLTLSFISQLNNLRIFEIAYWNAEIPTKRSYASMYDLYSNCHATGKADQENK
jgi:hypothetical protein